MKRALLIGSDYTDGYAFGKAGNPNVPANATAEYRRGAVDGYSDYNTAGTPLLGQTDSDSDPMTRNMLSGMGLGAVIGTGLTAWTFRKEKYTAGEFVVGAFIGAAVGSLTMTLKTLIWGK